MYIRIFCAGKVNISTKRRASKIKKILPIIMAQKPVMVFWVWMFLKGWMLYVDWIFFMCWMLFVGLKFFKGWTFSVG